MKSGSWSIAKCAKWKLQNLFAIEAALEWWYGGAHLIDYYSAELKARRQKANESLQELAPDIERLVHLWPFPIAHSRRKEVLQRSTLQMSSGTNRISRLYACLNLMTCGRHSFSPWNTNRRSQYRRTAGTLEQLLLKNKRASWSKMIEELVDLIKSRTSTSTMYYF